jgi:PilZ domain
MPASLLAALQSPPVTHVAEGSRGCRRILRATATQKVVRMNALKPQVLLKSKVSPSVEERRRSRRREINRVAKMQFGSGTLPRDCLITDISDGGVRLHVEGFDVPDDFILLLTGDDIGAKERIYRVVWRLGYEIGAKFVGHVRRTGIATTS